MKTVHVGNCPVCESKNSKKALNCVDYLVTNESFSIYRCPECNFGFTQDFPSENEIGKYYDAKEYISHSDTHKGFINGLYHIARKIALKSKTKLIQKYASNETGTLLDIGTGTGYFLQAMRHKNWVVTGIEKSESTRNYAHQKFELNVQDSDYLFNIPNEAKDVITMWHVLEHVERLNLVFENLYRILKKNGTLVIALPNKDSFDANHYKEYWAAYDVPRHLWHFSPNDFDLLANKHGFSILKMKGMTFDPIYISMLSEKNKKTKCANFFGILKGISFLFRSFFDTKKNSSIVYILKKK